MTSTAAERPILKAGDLVWVDLRPTRGREQSGARPAIVLTDREFHARNNTAIICPVTSNLDPWPSKVFLPHGLAVEGAVLADQIRCVDRASRGFRRVGEAPAAVLAEVRSKVAALIGLVLLDPT